MEQITFEDYSKVMELENKYEIPRKYQKEERWTDDWHYTEIASVGKKYIHIGRMKQKASNRWMSFLRK